MFPICEANTIPAKPLPPHSRSRFGSSLIAEVSLNITCGGYLLSRTFEKKCSHCSQTVSPLHCCFRWYSIPFSPTLPTTAQVDVADTRQQAVCGKISVRHQWRDVVLSNLAVSSETVVVLAVAVEIHAWRPGDCTAHNRSRYLRARQGEQPPPVVDFKELRPATVCRQSWHCC